MVEGLGEWLTAFYTAVKRPRTFMKILTAALVTVFILHFGFGIDGDWGGTNLGLSIEAAYSNAFVMLAAEVVSEWQRRNAEKQTLMLDKLVEMSRTSQKTLKGVLLIAEAQREMLIDHAAMLKSLRESDSKILDVLQKGETDEQL